MSTGTTENKSPQELSECVVLDALHAVWKYHTSLDNPARPIEQHSDEAKSRLRYNILNHWSSVRALPWFEEMFKPSDVIARAARFVDEYARRIPANPTDDLDFKKYGWEAIPRHDPAAKALPPLPPPGLVCKPDGRLVHTVHWRWDQPKAPPLGGEPGELPEWEQDLWELGENPGAFAALKAAARIARRNQTIQDPWETDQYPPPALGRYIRFHDLPNGKVPGDRDWRIGWAWGERAADGWAECVQLTANVLAGKGQPPDVCKWLPRSWPAELYPLGMTHQHLAGWAEFVRELLSPQPYSPEAIPPTHPQFGYQTLARCTRMLAHHRSIIGHDRLVVSLPLSRDDAHREVVPLLDTILSAASVQDSKGGGSGSIGRRRIGENTHDSADQLQAQVYRHLKTMWMMGKSRGDILTALRKPESKQLAEQVQDLIKAKPKTRSGKQRRPLHVVRAALATLTEEEKAAGQKTRSGNVS